MLTNVLWLIMYEIFVSSLIYYGTNCVVDLSVLKEIWNSPYSNDSFPVYAEEIDAGGYASPSSLMLSEVSRNKQITIVGGSIPERSGDKLYNTCCIFGSDGKLKAKHRKVRI